MGQLELCACSISVFNFLFEIESDSNCKPENSKTLEKLNFLKT